MDDFNGIMMGDIVLGLKDYRLGLDEEEERIFCIICREHKKIWCSIGASKDIDVCDDCMEGGENDINNINQK